MRKSCLGRRRGHLHSRREANPDGLSERPAPRGRQGTFRRRAGWWNPFVALVARRRCPPRRWTPALPSNEGHGTWRYRDRPYKALSPEHITGRVLRNTWCRIAAVTNESALRKQGRAASAWRALLFGDDAASAPVPGVDALLAICDGGTTTRSIKRCCCIRSARRRRGH